MITMIDLDKLCGIEGDVSAGLVASIQTIGLVHPLVVRPIQNGNFEVVLGRARLRALRYLKIQEVPCEVKTMSDNEMMEIRMTNSHPR